MPPHSFSEWIVGQNYKKPHKKHKERKPLRHVLSFEVHTDDELGIDTYAFAVPRGRPAQPKSTRATPKPALRYSSPERSSSLEPEIGIDANARGRRKRTVLVPEEESEDDSAEAIHAQHQARKGKKKVSFADLSLEENDTGASAERVSTRPKKARNGSAVTISVSSGHEGEREDDAVQTKVKAKKRNGGVSVAVAMSSGDESESEASIVNVKPTANTGKRLTGILKKTNAAVTSDSSAAESETDDASSKGKKTNASKSKKKNKSKEKKQKNDETDTAESTEDDDSGPPTETEEETEEEAKAQFVKKDKQKNKTTDKKAKAKANTNRKEDESKSTKKKDGKKDEQKQKSTKKSKPVSESESETVSESEPESVVEVKSKSKSKKEKGKTPKEVTSYPPARTPPYLRQPNMLLPPRTSVMQVEHAVEVPEDPRPNAFFDNDSGTARVYHGPAYGNPYGMLYPKRVYDYQNLPVGVPHPQQNPWYYGFPPAGGQPAPPNMPPPPFERNAADEANPWFRGYGVVGPGPAPPNMPLPPEFAQAKDKSKNNNDGHYNQLPPRSRGSRDRDAGWDSNVMPIPPAGSPTKDSNASQGSKACSSTGRPWDAQGVPDSPWSPDKQTEKKKKDRDSKAASASMNATVADIGKALQQVAAKDSADLRAREERWSNRSGSSKVLSPQPDNSSWNNNVNGGGWNTGNANNGSNSGWDNAAANNSNNDWNNANANNSNNNDDWGGNNNNTGGWDTNTNNNNDSGWDNAGPSNTNNNDAVWGNNDTNNNNNNNNDNNDKNNDWKTTSPPMPGTWGSPVPSNSSNRPPSNWSGGNVAGNTSSPPVASKNGNNKGKQVESGPNWGDTSLAQSSRGYWNTPEGKADLAEGTGHRKKNDNNES
ncbi:hypothetical protein F5B22DRAFT_11045 [Xylaria bambusicola]|uniref:uncharacterized protein n=1 Tax=Xylaria bambusicola TaxID=326684 RepID=UPI0020077D99|nr:uncharacterized protein F5B22DRAFT_11045 [Xylaria bambusicola]KAI0527925.1 hypothetical protein F5B22DRAFT_11045 [Xylaria bambusicola]